MAVDVRPITAAETRPLRAAVLRPAAPPERLDYPGDEAPESRHFGAMRNGEIVGIASLYSEPFALRGLRPAQRIRGMATHAEVRGAGFGAALVAACLDHARARGAEWVWCNARASAEGFYQRLGFDGYGERFDLDELGPHRVMAHEISQK